jgi:3-hydroxybutyryl-CoA dehydrogenase
MNTGAIQTVAVVGAGTMGAGIAQVLVGRGLSAVLVDSLPEALDRARSAVLRGLERWAAKEALGGKSPSELLSRLRTAGDIEAVAAADFVIEAVPEDVGLKKTVFVRLDQAARRSAVLASNTSSISITELGAATSRPEKVIGMHFMNPVPVLELVEVVRGQRTSEETHRTTLDLAGKLGKTAVSVEDYPGFVSNRVLMPMINEAIFCVLEGVAAPTDVDAVMRIGMKHPMGPLELADLIGLDVCLSTLEVLHRGLGDPKYRPCPLLRRMVAAGLLGRKSGQGFYEYGV